MLPHYLLTVRAATFDWSHSHGTDGLLALLCALTYCGPDSSIVSVNKTVAASRATLEHRIPRVECEMPETRWEQVRPLVAIVIVVGALVGAVLWGRSVYTESVDTFRIVMFSPTLVFVMIAHAVGAAIPESITSALRGFSATSYAVWMGMSAVLWAMILRFFNVMLRPTSST